jgi:NADPH2:quinone reductase
VAAFHEMGSPGGSYAEYALAWEYTTFHIPASKSFEGKLPLTFSSSAMFSRLTTLFVEAATIPLAALTAAVSVFRNLKLLTPWLPATEPKVSINFETKSPFEFCPDTS